MTGHRSAAYEPWRVCQLELAEPLPGIDGEDRGTGRRYRRAHMLVRLHTIPIGVVRVRVPEGGLDAASEAEVVWATLSREITAHLRADGLQSGARLTTLGLPGTAAGCRVARPPVGGETLASVVITTRDRPAELERCVDAVLALRHPRFEVLVVDNAPRDGSTEAMIGRRFGGESRIRYLRENRPGIAVARNTGLAHARGEVVAFTDDDVIVDADWLSRLAAGFSTERIGCVTGLTMPATLDSHVHAWFEEYGGFDKGLQPKVVSLESGRAASPLFPYAPGRLGSGNNMAFRSDVLRAVGGFDPCLGIGSPTHSGEDLAAFIRLLWAGWHLAYEPAALVWHHHRDTYAALRRQVYGYGVGLSACMLSCLSRQPGKLADFGLRLPAGLAYLLDPSSPKNRRRTAAYPPGLRLAEIAGLIAGPFAYARARRAWQGSVGRGPASEARGART